ncbi:MAG: hypothetical protein K8F52_04460 [Candidatus Scalindua rubra]|nr:hypothetical protein [Candidatus Scalindua rubra]
MREARLRGVNFSNDNVKDADFMWAKYLANEQKYYLRKNGAINVSGSPM